MAINLMNLQSSRGRLSVSVTKSIVVILIVSTSILFGCSNENKPAPEPKLNTKAKEVIQIKITTSAPGVDGVQVVSNWIIGNLSCAPINYPAGNINAPQINVNEAVTHLDSTFTASILEDRYVRDNCNWRRVGGQINFMHQGKILSIFQMNLEDSSTPGSYDIVCVPSGQFLGFCSAHRHLSYQEEQVHNKFHAHIEVLP